MSATAKSLHRATAVEFHRNDAGLVRCCLLGTEGHRCEGRIELHHVVSAQRLKKLHGRALFAARNPSPTMKEPPYYERLRAVTEDELVADGRNSAPVCTLAHRQIELGRHPMPRLPLVEAFCREYLLEHELPVWAGEVAA